MSYDCNCTLFSPSISLTDPSLITPEVLTPTAHQVAQWAEANRQEKGDNALAASTQSMLDHQSTEPSPESDAQQPSSLSLTDSEILKPVLSQTSNQEAMNHGTQKAIKAQESKLIICGVKDESPTDSLFDQNNLDAPDSQQFLRAYDDALKQINEADATPQPTNPNNPNNPNNPTNIETSPHKQSSPNKETGPEKINQNNFNAETLTVTSFNTLRSGIFLDEKKKEQFINMIQESPTTPDLMFFQEFAYDSNRQGWGNQHTVEKDVLPVIREATGHQDWYYSTNYQGLLSLSKHPIEASGTIEGSHERMFYSLNDTPQGDLLVINIHFGPGSDKVKRGNEVNAFIDEVRSGKHADIPKDTPVMVVGDANFKENSTQAHQALMGDHLADADVTDNELDYILFEKDTISVENTQLIKSGSASDHNFLAAQISLQSEQKSSAAPRQSLLQPDDRTQDDALTENTSLAQAALNTSFEALQSIAREVNKGGTSITEAVLMKAFSLDAKAASDLMNQLDTGNINRSVGVLEYDKWLSQLQDQ